MAALSKDRRAARELALEVLYQAEIRDQLPTEALSLQRSAGWSLAENERGVSGVPREEVVAYASALVEGVQQHAAPIDERITHYAQHWALDHMPVVDRNLLRLAIYELLWRPEVPTAVVINEAVELAKSLSTEASSGFINGILGHLAEDELPATSE